MKQLFSQEQARIAMALTMLPEPIEAIADRLDLLPEELSVRLDEMSNNGLIFKTLIQAILQSPTQIAASAAASVLNAAIWTPFLLKKVLRKSI
ncbi:MAG: hypothetical protein PVI60_03075 [Desulfobacteraceae bacterium]